MASVEDFLKRADLFIEPYLHRSGSPYGQYWGYVIVRRNGNSPIFWGKHSQGNKLPLDPFASRRETVKTALRICLELIGPLEIETETERSHDYDIHEDPWIDIGGEG